MIDEPNRPVQPDDMDGLLRAFFRSQLPRPWPAAPTPPARAVPMRRRGYRSRLALAASVALVALGALFAAGKIVPAAPDGVRLIDPNATRPDYLPRRDKVRTSLSLEQDPAGGTAIKVEVIDDVRPPK
jgi:hypothetical protein